MTDEELRALQEQAHQLDELTRQPGWAVLVDYSNLLMATDKLAVLNGDAKDWDTYLKRTGFFTGVHRVLGAPQLVAGMVTSELDRRKEQAE